MEHICQNCKLPFLIEPDDLEFYEKMQVPPPTFCPQCRLIRRLIWRNERSLYKRTCDLCKQGGISMYPADAPFPVYCSSCWYSDFWDPFSFGKEYNFSKSFFTQFRELLLKVPRQSLFLINVVNGDFCNFSRDAKNVYLSYSALATEDAYYCKNVEHSLRTFDCYDTKHSQNCYFVVKGDRNYNCSYLFSSRNCIDSALLYDCVNCKNCILSSGLRNKEFHIRNKSYSKDEYFKLKEQLDFGNYKSSQKLLEEFQQQMRAALHKYSDIVNCAESTGDSLSNTKHARYCFNVYDSENVKYFFRGFKTKDLMDVSYVGSGTQQCYESVNGGISRSSFIKFVTSSAEALQNVQYSDFCSSSSDLFGCIGLRSKKHCILNKQYDKQKYEQLVANIMRHMDEMPYEDKHGRVYRYGEFWPAELGVFAYNETVAQEHFPLTKAEAQSQGYAWKEPSAKNYEITISPEKLPAHINQVSEDILKQTIGCSHKGQCNEQCTTAFRIIPQELQFYKTMNIPVPRLCPNCRHYQRLSLRNPLKLWKRECACTGLSSKNGAYTNTAKHLHGQEGCPNRFETPYSSQREEIVYCEQCYTSEII